MKVWVPDGYDEGEHVYKWTCLRERTGCQLASQQTSLPLEQTTRSMSTLTSLAGVFEERIHSSQLFGRVTPLYLLSLYRTINLMDLRPDSNDEWCECNGHAAWTSQAISWAHLFPGNSFPHALFHQLCWMFIQVSKPNENWKQLVCILACSCVLP